jgi:hypothetical protein
VQQAGNRPGRPMHHEALVGYPLFEGAGATAAIDEVNFDTLVELVDELATVSMAGCDMWPVAGQGGGQRDVIAVGVEVLIDRELAKRQHGRDVAPFAPPAVQDSTCITHGRRGVILVLVHHSCMLARRGEHRCVVTELVLIAPLAGWRPDPSAMAKNTPCNARAASSTRARRFRRVPYTTGTRASICAGVRRNRDPG